MIISKYSNKGTFLLYFKYIFDILIFKIYNKRWYKLVIEDYKFASKSVKLVFKCTLVHRLFIV